ncbi:MAG: hypothetical protein JSW11_12100 [Candidatus Heimdallarchaeota archaeon]|nr:MAG: hypothetical protein JSW11_12100 [Candidatus Heimdallarchaeota archaeon]
MSDSEFVKKWSVEDDGTLTPVSLSSMSDLANDSVYIIVDENARKIFIWKGEKAPVRRKFISAKAAQQMRQEKYGMVYRIESLDPELEGADFLAIFGAKPAPKEAAAAGVSGSEVFTKPTPAPTPAPMQKPAAAPTRAPTAAPTRTPTAAPTRAPTAAPTRTPTAAPTRAPAAAPTHIPTPAAKPAPRVVKETEVVVTEPVKSVTPTTLDEVSIKLKEIEIPDDMEREIIIIGNMVFSAIKEHLALFSKDVVKLEPMDDLPSGIFPAAHYQVRLFIEDGRVIFTELLRQKTRSERDEFIDDMRKSLQDLSKMGI